MTSPYTLHPFEAILAAQCAAAAVVTALLVARPARPWPASALWLAAAWIAALRPAETLLVRAMGTPLPPSHGMHVLWGVEVLTVVGAGVTKRRASINVATTGALFLGAATALLRDSNRELEVAHLALVTLLAGLLWRGTRDKDAAEPAPGFARDDVTLFALTTALALLVAIVVLGRYTNSGDEWAPTYQAALFAKLHAYGAPPPCTPAFRTYWVFSYEGRTFEQYPPGWAFFMTPFVLAGAPWAAGPVAFGGLAVGVARLGRRAAATVLSAPRDVRAAGWLAALVVAIGWSPLIDGASRYAHVFVAALFAWALEATAVLVEDAPRAPTRWAAILGSAAALLLATRPADGAMLGIGLCAYVGYGVFERRLARPTLGTIALAFAAWAALTLVVLRLQLGRWFETGYAIAGQFAPDAQPHFSVPHASEWRYGVPLGAIAYAWWPCSPALGAAGLATLRGPRGRRLGLALLASFAPLLALYTFLEFGRGLDLGYGPRFLIPAIVPMAIGAGVLLAQLRRGARASPSSRAPYGIALSAVLVGTVAIAPLLYPETFREVRAHNRLHEAVARAGVHHAVVFGARTMTTTSPLDLPENLPLDLYTDQDVLLAFDRAPEVVQCVRETMPDRAIYRAVPGDDGVAIVPY